ncbi:hypothetical protein Elgi_59200 [Paenibacillus elgii]|nr:hypothetical protein Elgi_59200 [Paenibacillus elgii]
MNSESLFIKGLDFQADKFFAIALLGSRDQDVKENVFYICLRLSCKNIVHFLVSIISVPHSRSDMYARLYVTEGFIPIESH